MEDTSVMHELLGKTFVSVHAEESDPESCRCSGLMFEEAGGRLFLLAHRQDCCEVVSLHDICGDLSDLENSPLLQAEEVTNVDKPPLENKDYEVDSYTWTFYKFATIKGCVTVSFYGTSNGCYNESAQLEELFRA